MGKLILFWIMHPNRYLGALSKRESESEISEKNPDYCEKLTFLVFLETNFCIFTFFLGHCHCLFYD